MINRNLDSIIRLLKDPENVEIVWLAVCMRLNWITTGNPVLSRDDVRKMIDSGVGGVEFKVLETNQIDLVKRLEELKTALFEAF